MNIEFRIWLKKGDKKVFGEGPKELLRLVEELGSLRQAAIRLNMSYSKAWGIIKMLEENLGYTIITKNVGGSNGGGSYLTSEGKHLLNCYDRLNNEVEAFIKEKAAAIFDGQ